MVSNPVRTLTSATLVATGLALLQGCPQSSDTGDTQPQGQAGSAVMFAQFSAVATTGTAPVRIDFMDQSAGAVAWRWDFGDGGISTEQNPSHVYNGAGTFTVRLSVTGADGSSDTLVRQDFVTVQSSVRDASFETQAANALPQAPWTITKGTGHRILSSLNSFELDMPSAGTQWCMITTAGTDGTIPGDKAGIEQVVRHPAGRPILQFDSAFITEENDPFYNDFFELEISDGTTTKVVHRRDLLSPFGGGSSLFNDEGTVVETVTIDLADEFPGSDDQTAFTLRFETGNFFDNVGESRAYIDNIRFGAMAAAPTPSFTFTTNTVDVPIQFTDTSGPEAKAWFWDFGDGTSSNLQNPVHTFDDTITYNVQLRVSVPGGEAANVFPFMVSDDLCPMGSMTAAQVADETLPNLSVDFTITDNQDGVMTLYEIDLDFDGNFSPNVSTTSTTSPVVLRVPFGGPILSDINARVRITNLDDSTCASALVDSNAYQVHPVPVVTINAAAAIASVGDCISVTANSTAGNANTVDFFDWDFGGGNTFTTTTPSFDFDGYNVPGAPTVTVTARGPAGSSTPDDVDLTIINGWPTIYAGFAGCFSCHNAVNDSGGLALANSNLTQNAGLAYDELVGTNGLGAATEGSVGNGNCLTLRVDPGSATNSAVFQLMMPGGSCGVFQMTGFSGDMNELRDWINIGARETPVSCP